MYKYMSKNWIQEAHLKKGAFTKKAERAGMSVKSFRKKVLANKKMFSDKTIKQAILAKTFENMKH